MRSALTELFGIRHPVVSAPMAGSAGGALAAAVSSGGGLGLVGAGRGDRAWLDRELALVAGTPRRWGVGFLCWAASVDAVSRALEHGPSAVLLSFGDPSELAAPMLAADVPLIVMVTDLEEARCATGSSTNGRAARTNCAPMRRPVVRTRRPSPAEISITSRCGRARPST